MPPDNGPVTKADLKDATSSIEKLIQNELGHHAEDIGELRSWRDHFIAEGGPWRALNRRVDIVTLAIVIIVIIFALDKAPGIVGFLLSLM